MRIQHNIMAMNAYRNLGMNNKGLSKNLEKLSSGYRINRAGDDAAGLAISEKMRSQIAGLDQAQNNAQSGINLIQTAEGALTEVHDMLNRMVTLSTQAANGTYNTSDQDKIQSEINALTEEIDRIAENSNFNGIKLLDGTLGGRDTSALNDVYAANSVQNVSIVGGGEGDMDEIEVSLADDGTVGLDFTTAPDGVTWEAVNETQVGLSGGSVTFKAVVDRGTALAEKAELYEGMTITVSVDEAKTDGTFTEFAEVLTAGEPQGLTLQIGASQAETIKVNVDSMSAKSLNINSLDVKSVETANAAIKNINDAIEMVSVQRSNLGAMQNRLEHTINNLGVMEENIQDAEANIRDTDIAEEMMAYTKNNILIQSAQAMLAQANQVPQGVLQLMQ